MFSLEDIEICKNCEYKEICKNCEYKEICAGECEKMNEIILNPKYRKALENLITRIKELEEL